MKARTVYGVMVAVMLLLLTTVSGFARPPQLSKSSEVNNGNFNAVAHAPWFNIEVDTPGNTGQFTSVVINPSNGGTYISYYDATNKTLRMAMNRGFGTGNCGPDNSWLCQTVDSGGDFGKYSSIAINPVSGEIGIAYYDATNGKLKYAHVMTNCILCPWIKDTIDDGISFPLDNSGQYTSLKYHSDGTPYIAYYFENTAGVEALKVASSVSSDGSCGRGSVAGKWQCDTIQTGEGVGQYASLALDGAGNRHIAYYDATNGDLWYATSGSANNCGPGNTWTCYPVTGSTSDAGRYASLYVDNTNNFHIAYYDATAEALNYAVKVSGGGNCGVLGSAQCDEIDDMPADYHPLGIAIAESDSGYPIIAYQSITGALNVARPGAALGLALDEGNCGPFYYLFPSWNCETIDRPNKWVDPPYRNGDYISIATNASGVATIAYYEYITASDGNLGVSYQRVQVFMPLIVK